MADVEVLLLALRPDCHHAGDQKGHGAGLVIAIGAYDPNGAPFDHHAEERLGC